MFYKSLTAFVLYTLFSAATVSAKSPSDNRRDSSFQQYPSNLSEGLIGVTAASPVDNPADNIFHIKLKTPLKGQEQVYLVYDLDGVEDHTAVSRSINDQLSVGGYLVKKRTGWARQRERISATWLKPGDNVIRFTIPEGATHSYRIKNVTLEVAPAITEAGIVVNQPQSLAFYKNQAYVKGFVPFIKNEAVRVRVAGKEARVWKGEFEAIIEKPAQASAQWQALVEVLYPNGAVKQQTVSFSQGEEADHFYPLIRGISFTQQAVFPAKKSTVSIKGAAITVLPGAVKTTTAVSITALRDVDIPALDAGMVNVTAQAHGFRFLPHGIRFQKEAAITLGYDESKIPEGYTEKDIKTYYFDEQTHHWVPLKLDFVLEKNGTVVSRITHFTDMINAIIKVPESPEVQAYNSTSMKGIKAANPTASVNLINPPSANNMGNASIGYSITIPAGRAGMQPQVGINYNSGGSNGWLGLGWNLSMPALSIDTRWGVPRFDAGKETETYSLNGEQLSPVAHRGELQDRTTEKQFYPRVEGAFNKIIRHGNHPNNYWWEVTDKNGTRYFYGGTPESGVDAATTLSDAAGNKAHWALKETRDLNGNFVRYHYAKVEDVGLEKGTVPGYQLYIDKITYTGHGNTEGKYSILFTRDRELGEAIRSDVSIAANLGFKQVTADLLRKIEVQFEDKNVRHYELKYKSGEFLKTLLSSITEYDSKGISFNTHTFDYHNDIRVGSTVTPFKPEENWNPQSDNVRGDFINPLNAFNDDASALSGTKSKDVSVGLAVTVGFNADVTSKSLSVGGNVGYSQSNSEGLLSLIDINGDGRPDKVFIKNDKITWRPNTGQTTFGAERTVTVGPNAFFKEKSKTVNGGVEGHGPRSLPVFAGAGISKTTSTTTVYFAEVNGDMLPDIIVNGKVFFSHINEAGNPEFTQSSGDTPSPIFQEGSIPGGLIPVSQAEIDEAINQAPLHDVVRMWQAPYDGQVAINSPVQLVHSNDPDRLETPADGVRVAIQLKGNELWSKHIQANDYSKHTPTGVSAVTVRKGERIYFRVQSVMNGSYDQVKWEPVISYLNNDTSLKDANNKTLYTFSATEDFVVTAQQEVATPIKGQVRIQSTFVKPFTTDDVRLEIRKKVTNADNSTSTTTIWSKDYTWNQEANDPISLDLSVDNNQAYSFHVLATTTIAWPQIKWNPYIYYESSSDPAYPTVKDANNKPLVEFYAVPEYTMYNRQVVPTQGYVVPDSVTTLTIKPTLQFQPGYNGEVYFSIKKKDTLAHKEKLVIMNGVVNNVAATAVAVRKDERLFFEYHTANTSLAAGITNSTVEIIQTNTSVNHTAGAYTQYQEENEVIFGPLYRGWGQFAYNGNRDRANTPINESLLKLSDALKNQQPIAIEGKTGEALENEQVYDPSKEDFIVLVPTTINTAENPAVKEAAWIGYDNLTYVSRSIVSSSRLGDDDLSAIIPNPGEGSGARAINKISKTVSRSYSLGASVGSLGGSYTHSTSDMKVLSDFMDLNGDRYPDIVTEGKVLYTTARGGLSERTYSHGSDGNHHTHTESDGATISGSFALSKAEPSASNSKKVTVSVGSGQSSAGLSGNVGEGTSNTGYTWMDINGDGLPDKVFQNRTVALNLGYSFAAAEPWDFTTVQDAESKSEGAGLGISIVNGSITAGIGLSRSDNNVKQALQDVNGDGLVDVVIEGNPIKVRLNRGNGFGPLMNWTGSTQINKSSSSSESANAAFTVGIYIPFVNIKITINPSASLGHGVTRDLEKFTDMDGDGYPDYVISDKDNKLTVARSTIGRTNLLKGVQRPLGASFTLDYTRIGNTYQMPNDVWALTDVRVFDGFVGDGIDTLRTTYEYEGGYYDRHERDFYGFKTVKNQSRNTADAHKIYTVATQTFSNDNFYTKGVVLTELMQSADGKKYVEKENVYQLRDIESGIVLSDSYKKSELGAAFVALKETIQRFYEGQASAGKTTRTTYGYDTYGNVTNFTDYGDEGDGDDISAAITYHKVEDKYIVGSPKSIVVTGNGKTYRKREAIIDESTGDVKQIKQYIDANTKALHDLEYDAYGNLKKMTRPANAKGQRLSVEYEYDPVVHTYPTKVSNSYGYSSKATYDYRYGQSLTSTDLNGQVISYKLDDLGRIIQVTGPYEKSGYTIKFEYHPEAAIPWALTRHFDPAHPGNDMLTATFVDGLGRVLQTKKDVALYDGEGKPDKEQMVVSGKVIYDGLGRVTTTYYPVTEAVGNPGILNTHIDTVTPSLTTYDVVNRVLTITLPDGAVTETIYSFGNDRAGKKQFSTKTIDANGKQTEQFTDVRGRITAIKNHTNKGPIWTSFVYNAINEQVAATDDQGHTTLSEYDLLGRRISRKHPDAGLNTFSYDAVGNVVGMVTANLRKDTAAITYEYEYERLTKVNYPNNPQNNVTYTYGSAEAAHNRAGRIVLQEDATGAQEFFYGPLGEIVKNIRTVVIPHHSEQTFVTEWKYDTWNRLTDMIYPDEEKVTYTYNTGGLLHSMTGKKKNNNYTYVTQLGYDKFEQRVFLAYGNGTKTTYNYEADRRRLKNMVATTAAGRAMMDNTYGYDKVNNILSLVNNAPIPTNNLMGGASNYSYEYDDLYRLTEAHGSFKRENEEHRYTLEMQYNTVGGITQKTQKHDKKTGGSWITQKKTTYDLTYTYSSDQPHAPIRIGKQTYSYDENGNGTGWKSDVSGQRRRMIWDEENRLQAVYDNGALYHYVYDASGERVLKGQSTGQAIFVNGDNKGGSGGIGNFTVYVNPYIVLKSGGYSKHYYIEGQRIASKLGGGWDDKNGLKPAGDSVDYKGKGKRIFDGIVKNLKFLGADGQILTAGKSGKIPPGQIKGTGNVGNGNSHASELFQYYYHPDHLGSTSYVTDAAGEVYQHLEYFAFGETFIEEHSNTERTPYLFNGKELDEETGLYYYGARYYDPKTSIWGSVDPLTENYPEWSPYNYSFNNPLRFIDPDGREPSDEITATDREMAKLADDVYQTENGQYKKDATKNDLGGWKLSKKDFGVKLTDNKTGFNSAVYEKEVNGETKYVYVTQGSDFGNKMVDWSENYKQSMGQYSAQYDQSVKNARKLQEVLGDNLSFTGHSLGGGLASANARATGLDATTFNAAGLSKGSRSLYGLNQPANIKAFVVEGEIVSYSQRVLGLRAEGNIHKLSAWYIPSIPFAPPKVKAATATANLVMRAYNHTMGAVMSKMGIK